MKKCFFLVLIVLCVAVSAVAWAEPDPTMQEGHYFKGDTVTSVTADSSDLYAITTKTLVASGWKPLEKQFEPRVACEIKISKAYGTSIAAECERPHYAPVTVRNYTDKPQEIPSLMEDLLKKYSKAMAAVK